MEAWLILQSDADRLLDPEQAKAVRRISENLDGLVRAAKDVAGRQYSRGAKPAKATLMKDKLRRAIGKFDPMWE